MLYKWVRPILFKMEEEKAHALTLSALDHFPGCFFPKTNDIPVKAMGLVFRHPVGIAAGLDKDGKHLNGLAKLHPSFIEVGTVTPKAQAGNDKPRIFRISQENALINRMGFNNDGIDALINRLQQKKYNGLLGINIGKNRTTPIEKAAEDFKSALEKVYIFADYITINISSPNTPDLRRLQNAEFFPVLLAEIQHLRSSLASTHHKKVPILIKISPDETNESLQKMAGWVCEYDMDGIIATNTTVNLDAVKSWLTPQMKGGLSGKPLAQRSLQCLTVIRKVLGTKKCLISVGGIDSVGSAQERLQAGANLIQLYTGLIYKGPGLIRNIVNSLK